MPLICRPTRDGQGNGGSGSHGQVGGGIGVGLEELTEAGAELAVEDGAADLKQQVARMIRSLPRQFSRPTTRSASCLRRDDTSLGALGFDSTLPRILRSLTVGHDGILRE